MIPTGSAPAPGSAAVMKDVVISLKQGLVGEAVRSMRPLNIEDAYKNPNFNRKVDDETGFRTKSILCVPIMKRGRVLAVLQCMNKNAADSTLFTELDTFLLYVVGYAMADVVQQCRTAEVHERLVTRKNSLISCAAELFNACHTVDRLTETMTFHLKELFKVKSCALFIRHGETALMCMADETERELLFTEFQKEDTGESMVWRCVGLNSSVTVQAVDRERVNWNPDMDLGGEDQSAWIHCWPVRHTRRMTAVLQFVCPPRREVDFGDDGVFAEKNPAHVSIMDRFAAFIGHMIERIDPEEEGVKLPGTRVSRLSEKLSNKASFFGIATPRESGSPKKGS